MEIDQKTTKQVLESCIGEYQLVSKFDGNHLYSVYLGTTKKYHMNQNDKNAQFEVAIKLIPANDFRDSFDNECRIFALKPHKNIVRCIECLKDTVFKLNSNQEEKYNALVLEYYPNKDLFEYIIRSRLEEPVIRYYLEQMLDGLEFLVTNGYSHRDVKLENFLLDKDFNLVFTDFGHSCRYSDDNGPVIFKEVSAISTEEIMPPEFFREDGYRAKDLDVFALGKVLLTMVTGSVPFTKADKTDRLYSLILNGNWHTYWRVIKKRLEAQKLKDLSPKFKKMIQGMLEPNPKLRYSLKHIRESLWYQETTPLTSEEVKKVMLQLKQQF